MNPRALRSVGAARRSRVLHASFWGKPALAALAMSLPLPARADVCAEARPGWDGVPVSALAEALSYLSSPAGLVLLLLTALAVRFRHQWGGLAVVCLWSVFVALIAFPDEGQRAAIVEGCRGSPVLAVAIAVAVSTALILYTLPRPPD